ncbi:dTMP kinase [Psychrobacter sp. ANT_H56B]|uniref:dTMP kinase n=1 Tax=unclassified Psychrobacter TaxID=196806 RepID=UPI0011EE9282|nr:MULTISPECIES: dTMP kinase [unclassified Psychrobacter]KAA0927379.1 dTMP kinase [Psychrobacter sp. ANT_H56B]KAA0939020.1 dTMP kinase [Psychrobacter sp. ANT_H59]
MSASIQAPFSQTTTTPTQGCFISFEGTEGVGKTTAIEQLCARLQARGIDYVRTREPGGSPFSERLREILLDPNTAINDDTELLLMFAARCDHMQQVILPALQRGTWVICDRFTDSTVAYQGFGRADGDAIVRAKIDMLIEQFVVQLPELTLWLDLPVLEGMARANKRSAADRFEQQATEFFTRVHQGFSVLASEQPERIQRIDASGSANEVSARIWQTIEEKLDI